MPERHPLSGVYAAVVTPLREDFSPDAEALPPLLDFLARRGCHGVLLLGTTGEGPSFAPSERLELMRAATQVRQIHPHLRLMAGTGTPSLEETIQLSKAAFDLGYDAVVVLPPYYYRQASEEGLFTWYRIVIQRAVPRGGYLLAYHIPPVSGVSISLDLLARLKDAFPEQFAGLKDSSTEAKTAEQLGERFGQSLLVMNGTDRLFSLALQAQASGCITALANLISPLLRQVWEQHLSGEPAVEAQARLNQARSLLEAFPPAPALIKTILARRFNFAYWPVRPPLMPLANERAEQAVRAWSEFENG